MLERDISLQGQEACNGEKKGTAMWIEALKNGKFKAVERYEDFMTGERKRVSLTMEKNTAQSRKQAQAALQKKIGRLRHAPAKSEELTLEQLSKRYLEAGERSLKPSSLLARKFDVKVMLSLLGEKTLVNRMDADYIVSALLSCDKKIKTKNAYLQMIKKMLRWGYKQRYVSNLSSFDHLEKFREDAPQTEIQKLYLEASELNLLLEKMKVRYQRERTAFLVLTGLRIGEAQALTIQDVDLKNRVIKVTKDYDSRNQLINPTPKTSSSNREVFIQDELFELARKMKRDAMERKMASGLDYFLQYHGEIFHAGSYANYLKNNAQKYIGRPISPHKLRHTHTSLLAEQGVDLETISRRLGHENSEITKKIYLHVTEKVKEKDKTQLKNVNILQLM